ncbi:MAG: SAM-dependent methyltransferase [Chloroflexi bacterium]|nr:SAM-dependent methyltransferase [Chloroflexota bacterium]
MKACGCNAELKRVVLDRIAEKGRITFAEYMDMALYYPELGYYTSPERKIGKEGDFYTSPCVHPIFGAMIAEQLHEMWEVMARPDGFTIAEFGAGTGFLAFDIMSTIRPFWPELFEAVRYVIVEASRHLVARQQEQMAALALPSGKVEWAQGIPRGMVGCVMSNELVDALPVHRVRHCASRESRVGSRPGGEGLREIYVAADGDRLVEVLDEPATPEIVAYLDRLGVRLAEEQEAEVGLAALSWLREVAEALRRGFVLTIDYGYEAEELYGPRFPKGTLVGYRHHQVVTNAYEAIGRQDLTAHVNFSVLMRWGEELGLDTTGFTNQMRFLLALGIAEKAAAGRDAGSTEAIRRRLAARQLFMPGGMGEVFKVLIQHKGLERPQLRGLSAPW